MALHFKAGCLFPFAPERTGRGVGPILSLNSSRQRYGDVYVRSGEEMNLVRGSRLPPYARARLILWGKC
jgi:hypothetical protein